MKFLNRRTILTILFIITTPWTYIILKNSLIIFFLVLLSTFALSLSFEKKIPKYIVVFLFLILTCIYFFTNFDNKRYGILENEYLSHSLKSEYYAKEYGKLYRNRLGVFYFNKYQLLKREYYDNLYNSLNFSSYFNVSSKETKIYIVFIPLFILGVVQTFKNMKDKEIFTLFMFLILIGVTTFKNNMGLFAAYSMIIFLIVEGVNYLLNIIWEKRN